jgi:hypothetical protein
MARYSAATIAAANGDARALLRSLGTGYVPLTPAERAREARETLSRWEGLKGGENVVAKARADLRRAEAAMAAQARREAA